MQRLGLTKKYVLNRGIDNLLRNIKYNRVNLIKSEDNKKISKIEKNILSEKNINEETLERLSIFDNISEAKDLDRKIDKTNNIENKQKVKRKLIRNNVQKDIIKKADKRKNKKRRLKKRLILLAILISVIFIIFETFTTLIEPSLIAMCEIRANSIGVTVSSKAVKQVMEEVGYDIELVNLEKDNEGNIIALKANVVEMNYIASLIGSRTQQMYNELTDTYVQIPIGNFTGNALLAGRGPRIRVKIMPVGTVGSDFKTEFVSSGINQTRHRVYLQVVSSMRVIAPFSTKTIKVINNVNVAETVLIGNVPNSYYNLEGVDNVVDDSLNLWDE